MALKLATPVGMKEGYFKMVCKQPQTFCCVYALCDVVGASQAPRHFLEKRIMPHSIAGVIGYYSALEVGDPMTSRDSSDSLRAENSNLPLPG